MLDQVAIAAQLSPEQIEVKPQRTSIPARIRKAIALLARGECKSQSAAAKRCSISESQLCRWLQKEHVRVFLAQEMRRTVATAGIRAAHRVAELIDAGSEHVSLDASKHVLAINGVKPQADAQVSVNIDIKAGYVIDLSDGRQAVTIEHTANPSDDDD